MMFDYWVSSRMEFTLEDKRECLETTTTIAGLAMKVRQGGISALKAEIGALDPLNDKLLIKAINLIVGGVIGDEVRKILQNYIIVGNYRNRRLLKRLLVMEGMIALQNGHSPEFIRDFVLASFFGEGFQQEYAAYTATAVE